MFYNSKWHCTLCIDSRQGGRDENQDSYGYKETSFGFLVVVCDGMGGGPAGANASILAVQSIIQEVDKAAQAQTPATVLKNAVNATNAFLRRTIREHRELNGMGTTCVAALFSTSKVIVAHVGDSRLYQFRSGKQLFKTADHSIVGEMVRKGEITEDEARRAENSNVITRSLGISDTIDVEMDILDIIPDDRIVLCTDGFWGMLQEKDLADFLCKKDRLDYILSNLLDKIDGLGKNTKNGNYDNLSLGIIHINKHENLIQQKGKFPWLKLLMAFILLISFSLNVYFTMTKETFRSVPQIINNDVINKEEKNIKEKNFYVDDDVLLEQQYAKRREHDYNDSIVVMQRQIKEKILDKTTNVIPQVHVRLLNQIVDGVKSLDTPKGGDANKVLNTKRVKQRQIIKDFECLRKDFENSDVNRKKYNDVLVRLSGDIIIATQLDGASTMAAKQEITKVADQLNELKQR